MKIDKFELFNQVQELFRISDDAFEIYYYLKNTNLTKGGDILNIYSTNQELRKGFYHRLENITGFKYDVKKKIIHCADCNIYFKTIEELTKFKNFDGLRFRRINFWN